MVYFNYTPLFDYLESNGITRESLVLNQVVGEGVMNRMKHNKNIQTASILRIMDYLQINDISLILVVIEVKDDDTIKIQESMKYNYYSKK